MIAKDRWQDPTPTLLRNARQSDVYSSDFRDALRNVTLVYNSKYHDVLYDSPFFPVSGREPTLPEIQHYDTTEPDALPTPETSFGYQMRDLSRNSSKSLPSPRLPSKLPCNWGYYLPTI